ncbi:MULTISPECIES: heavy metal translocating P-type ATPase [unclassified Thioalkalivibrio]|uniref:heavy metal translocating P-type ATPase n=1 Tax=unclassified Thioalkalivibrio TaxID=2621013 RepID=UPI00056EF64C|nr:MULTISPECIES: heavy metal translocating P-type ATPase [unclassified Thioalkalivibrio]
MSGSRPQVESTGTPADADGGCFHCGLPIPGGANYPVQFEGRERPTCCPGCQAVAGAIIERGLGAYYHHRPAPPGQAGEPLVPDELRELELFDTEAVQRSFVTPASDAATTGGSRLEAALILEGITCAACVWLNERHVQSLPGVIAFSINYSTHRARLVWDPERIALSAILKAIRDIGYHAHPYDPGTREKAIARERGLALRRIGVAALGMMQVMMLALAIWLGEDDAQHADLMQFMRWVAAALTTPVVFYSAIPFYQSAWRDLRQRRLGMDVPVSLAIIVTYVASLYAVLLGTGEHVYFESVVMFVFFLLTSRYLELIARQHASQAIDRLDRLVPALAHRLDAGGQEEPVALGDLSPGDRVRVRPGESVPADGFVVQGRSTINRALLTGEPDPAPVAAGDEVVGGTINVDGPLIVEVRHVGAETTLAAIQRLLDRAQSEKPRIARIAETGTGWFVGAVLLLTALAGLVWYAWIDPSRALWVMVAMLVATCPCALALATPVALTATTGTLSRLGLLVTRGRTLEALARVDTVCLDKTGTLTEGRPRLVAQQDHVAPPPGQDWRTWAAALEAHSEHPLSRAFRAAVPAPGVAAQAVHNEPGSGLVGQIDGREVAIGGRAMLSQTEPPAVEVPADSPLASPVWLVVDGQPVATFWLADTPRPEAAETVATLRARGLEVILLTGDRPEAGQRFAEHLGIDRFHGGLTPEDKLRHVRDLQAAGRTVLMAGEGINDAPVLAGADVSLAMGGGTRLAQTQADLVLTSDRLDRLPEALDQARRTTRIVRQNIAWAIGYNVVALPIAAAGLLTPWLAALGMSMSSLLVVGNALRLRPGRDRVAAPREHASRAPAEASVSPPG